MGPWTRVCAQNPSDSGEGSHRRRGRGGGKGLGLGGEPWGTRGWAGGGRRRRLHGGAEAAEGFIQVRRARTTTNMTFYDEYLMTTD